MQQMAGNMGLIHPFVFNQFGAYGSYAQVLILFTFLTKLSSLSILLSNTVPLLHMEVIIIIA